MTKSNLGERIAMVEAEINNLKKDINTMSTKVDDIYVALLGDGQQNLGALSRIKTLEDLQNSKERFNKWKYNALYLIITILSGLSSYLFFFR